jgi:hypothetical protein
MTREQYIENIDKAKKEYERAIKDFQDNCDHIDSQGKSLIESKWEGNQWNGYPIIRCLDCGIDIK